MRGIEARRWGALAIILFLLFTAFVGFFGYGLYALLRWVVCLASLYWAFRYWKQRQYIWVVFVLLAILFNPIAKISFTRGTWQFIDLIAALVYCYPLLKG